MESSTSQAEGDQTSAAKPAAKAPGITWRARVASAWLVVKPALPFFASWALLDAMLNVRYPGPEPPLWYLIPSVDVLLLFFYFAVFGWNRWHVPKAVRIVLVLGICFVRVLRFGDGTQRRFFFQPFNVYTDLHLVPELVRFTYATLPWWKFVPLAVAVVGGAALLVVATYYALACVEGYLSVSTNVRNTAVIAGVSYLVLAAIPTDPYFADLYYGGFAASVFPRLRHEARFLMNVYGYSAERSKAITVAQEHLAQVPSNLAKLKHRNVYLILVESYGQSVFEVPLLEERSHGTFDAFESELTERGFNIVTGALDSPTYGGQSWLAHSTLATTVRVADALQYDLVCAGHPKTMAMFFRDAGYRTVLVHPGTQRAWPKGEFYHFDQKYYAWNFDYQGPDFAWATMPDQFVLDWVRRNELDHHHEPLFVQYVLVSSHAPWSDQPVRLDDWSKIQNGSIFHRLEVVRYPITWPDFTNASEAYIRSIVYDFEVLQRYIADYVKDDSLLVILGDHQPVREVSGEDEHYGVPVHVLSRDPELVKPFMEHGYVRGMRPVLDEPHLPMEQFMLQFLRDYSTSPAGGSN